MDKIKVLHITQALGGVKTYIIEIFRNIDPQRFELVLLAPPDPEFRKVCREEDVQYIEIDFQRQISPIKDLAALMKIISVTRREKPHLLHVHSAKGGMLGKISAYFHKVPIVFTPNAFSYLQFKGIKRSLFYLLEYFSHKKVHTLLAVSYSEMDRAVNEVGYKREQVVVVPNTTTFDNIPYARNFDRCVHIGMIGRLTYQKNPLMFLEMAKAISALHPHIRFQLLGAGFHDDLMKPIEEYIKTHDLQNVQLLSWGEMDITGFYKSLDIFVLTSAFEGLPFSLLESMKFQLPCVVTNVDGNKDVIKDNYNGLLANSSQELTDQVARLIADVDLRRRLGMAGKTYVQSVHNSNVSTRRIAQTYLHACGR